MQFLGPLHDGSPCNASRKHVRLEVCFGSSSRHFYLSSFIEGKNEKHLHESVSLEVSHEHRERPILIIINEYHFFLR